MASVRSHPLGLLSEQNMYDETYDRLIAEHYDGTYEAVRDPIGDAAFYARLAEKTGGPVLELGCGTGRVLLPIAATGVECVGIDASLAMLEVLRRKDPPRNLECREGLLETFSLNARFNLITCPFRAFQHLTSIEQQLACLERVREHLTPSGLFAFDVFDPDLARIAPLTEPEALDATFTDGEDQIERFASVTRDHTTQTQEVHFRFERRRDGELIDSSDTSITMRWFYRYELEHLLARAGFEVEALYGGYDERPYDAAGEIIPSDDKRSLYQAGNMLWHADGSFRAVPLKASFLSAKEVPPAGGETEFASVRAASADLRQGGRDSSRKHTLSTEGETHESTRGGQERAREA